MGNRILLAAALVAYVISTPRAVDACVHAAGAHGPVPVTQKGHQGLLIWADGHEELVLKIEYESGEDPAALGLVIPVPAVPSQYKTAPLGLFSELGGWVNLRRDQPQLRSRSMGVDGLSPPRRPTNALVALPAASAGPYRIQPLQAFGEEGVTALTAWMEEHHFAPIPRSMLTYYIDRGWTFLTVKVDPEEGASLGRRGGLPPLQVRFAAERALYPLKLEAQGTFPVRLYLITREALGDDAFAGATERGFEVARGGPFAAIGGRPGRQLRVDQGLFRLPSAPPALREVLEGIGGFDEGELRLRVLLAERFGTGSANSMSWEEELSFPAVDAGQRLMGTAAPEDPVVTGEGEGALAEAALDQAGEAGGEGAPSPGATPQPPPAPGATPAPPAAGTTAADEGGLCTAAGRPPTSAFALIVVALAFTARRALGWRRQRG